MRRNRLLLIGLLTEWLLASASFADDSALRFAPIKVGISAPFTGPAEALGNSMRFGIDAYLKSVNRQGGVRGRQVHLITLDDAYEPRRTAPNMRSLADDHNVLAVLGNVGTPTASVAVPIANEKRIPLIGAFTGANLLRRNPPDRYVVNYRASYEEEIEEIVNGLIDELGLSPEHIGFFTQDDSYGDAGWYGGIAALESRGYERARMLPHGRYRRNTSNVELALGRLLDPRVDVRAVIMVGAYRPCARFIQLARKHDFHPIFVNVSFVGSKALCETLGPTDGEGVVITQVVPFPEGKTPAAREFQQALAPSQRNFVSFEGFIVGKLFVKSLEMCDEEFSSESLVDAMERGEELDLGTGVQNALSPHEHQFSHRVWKTVIRDGKLVELTSWRDLRGNRVYE